MTGRVLRLAVLALALLLASAAIAEGAVEKRGGYTFVTKQKNVGASNSKGVLAECPGDTHVLSGGYRTNATHGDSGLFDAPSPSTIQRGAG